MFNENWLDADFAELEVCGAFLRGGFVFGNIFYWSMLGVSVLLYQNEPLNRAHDGLEPHEQGFN